VTRDTNLNIYLFPGRPKTLERLSKLLAGKLHNSRFWKGIKMQYSRMPLLITLFNNPPEPKGIEVVDPTHLLFGRKFRLLS